MEGQETFKFAVNAMCGHIRSMAGKIGADLSDIRLIVPHQANLRIIAMASRMLGIQYGCRSSNIASKLARQVTGVL